MSEEYGSDYITITDDEGNDFTLEVLDGFEYEGNSYGAFLPADMDEKDPDYGLIILKIVEENGEELFESIDDEDLLQEIYEYYMTVLFPDDEECCCGGNEDDGCCCSDDCGKN